MTDIGLDLKDSLSCLDFITRPSCKGLGLGLQIFCSLANKAVFRCSQSIACQRLKGFSACLPQTTDCSLNTAFRLAYRSCQKRCTLFKHRVTVITRHSLQ